MEVGKAAEDAVTAGEAEEEQTSASGTAAIGAAALLGTIPDSMGIKNGLKT
jgi:hypothetical protein